MGGRFILDSGSGRYQKLPYSGQVLDFSPGSRSVVVQRASTFLTGPIQGPLGKPVEIPILLKNEDKLKGWSLEMIRSNTLIIWLSENRLLLLQRDHLGIHGACRIYDVGKQRWLKPPGGCPDGSYNKINGFERGPDNLLAVYSSGEGHPAVNMVAYTPEGIEKKLKVPEFDLYPSGPLTVSFYADRSRLFFLTTCHLGKKRPCVKGDGTFHEFTDPWRLYAWHSKENATKLVHAGLPVQAIYSARKNLLAWPGPGKVCISALPDLKQARCHPVLPL